MGERERERDKERRRGKKGRRALQKGGVCEHLKKFCISFSQHRRNEKKTFFPLLL